MKRFFVFQLKCLATLHIILSGGLSASCRCGQAKPMTRTDRSLFAEARVWRSLRTCNVFAQLSYSTGYFYWPPHYSRLPLWVHSTVQEDSTHYCFDELYTVAICK
ncbi:hypothetical protein GQ55_9G459700 [Panicum hallii var. hallii]|uniref:Secreted protein n=1 Tax=Panicum hallii var. hallii TaxID=1504633 RepID=A0A2T7CC28_9POAL|nr:hypothetical protein GQ55_9G459700 [Panicum hallii var. hallii]